MPSPTFVSATTVAAFNNNTSPKTVSVTVNNGDCLAILIVADGPNGPYTVSGGGLTYTLGPEVNTASKAGVAIYTAEATSTQTFTLSVSETAGTYFGFSVLRFSSAAVAGSGATAIDSGSNNTLVSITTANANSAVVCCASDFDAHDGSSRAWNQGTLAGTEEFYAFASPNYTVYGGYNGNAGTAGTYTIGPTNNGFTATATSVAALEIKYQAPSGSNVTEVMSAAAVAWAGTSAKTVISDVELGEAAAIAWAGTTATTSLTTSITELAKPAATAWAGTTAQVLVAVVKVAGAAGIAWSGAAPALDMVDLVTGTGPPAIAWAGTTITASFINPTIESASAAGMAWAGTKVTTVVATVELAKPSATAFAGTSALLVIGSSGDRTSIASPAGVAWAGTNGTVAVVTVSTHYLYTPPTWRHVQQMESALRVGVQTCTLVYRSGGVWYNQFEGYPDNPVVANVDTDAASGLLLFFSTPTVIPSSLYASLSALTQADPSWTPASFVPLP